MKFTFTQHGIPCKQLFTSQHSKDAFYEHAQRKQFIKFQLSLEGESLIFNDLFYVTPRNKAIKPVTTTMTSKMQLERFFRLFYRVKTNHSIRVKNVLRQASLDLSLEKHTCEHENLFLYYILVLPKLSFLLYLSRCLAKTR